MALDPKDLTTLGRRGAEDDARLAAAHRIVRALDERLTAVEGGGDIAARVAALEELAAEAQEAAHAALAGIRARIEAAEARLTDAEAAQVQTGAALTDAIARIEALEGDTPEEPGEPIALIVAPVLTLREDAPVGSAVAAVITDADTLALGGDDADLLTLDGNDVRTAASIDGRTALAFAVTGRAPGKVDVTEAAKFAVSVENKGGVPENEGPIIFIGP